MSENTKEIPFSKHVSFINDYININLNDKKILNKLYNMLKNKTVEEYDKFFNISKSITEYIQELIFDEEIRLVQVGDIDPIDIFKSVSIEVESSNENLIENFLEYITISKKFMETKLFIFINMKEFFSTEEIIQIYNNLLLEKTKFILIQSNFTNSIDCREISYIIDADCCEI